MGKRKKRLTMAKYATKYAMVRQRIASKRGLPQEQEAQTTAEVLEEVTAPLLQEEEIVEAPVPAVVPEPVAEEPPKPAPKRKPRAKRKPRKTAAPKKTVSVEQPE